MAHAAKPKDTFPTHSPLENTLKGTPSPMCSTSGKYTLLADIRSMAQSAKSSPSKVVTASCFVNYVGLFGKSKAPTNSNLPAAGQGEKRAGET